MDEVQREEMDEVKEAVVESRTCNMSRLRHSPKGCVSYEVAIQANTLHQGGSIGCYGNKI